MDERLKGRWLSFRVKAAGQRTTRGRNLVVKIISKHVVLIALKVEGKWKSNRLNATIDNNKIMDGNKCLFYVLEVTDTTLKLFSEDKWTVYEMEPKPEN